MEAPKNATPLHQINVWQTRAVGKIIALERHEKIFLAEVVSPAADEYSYPSRFILRSKVKLGEMDDVVNVLCKIAGSVRREPYADKKTGEQKLYRKESVFFDVID